MKRYCFIDFDDTLVMGVQSWVLSSILPALLKEHDIVFDAEQFNQELLKAIEASNQSYALEEIGLNLFKEMTWPPHILKTIFNEIQTSYQPILYEDAMPFLERLLKADIAICIISNNPHAAHDAPGLGLTAVVQAVITPDKEGVILPKPSTTIWTHLQNQFEDIDVGQSFVVGDDPWTDGAFATAIDLPCFLVDREQRFRSLYETSPHVWVQSLDEIPF